MTKLILGMTVGLTLSAATLWGQTGAGYGVGRGGVGSGVPVEYQQFQQAGTIGAVAAGRAEGTMVRLNSGPLTVIGRPVSATEERQSKQTLGDGTEISTSESNLFYRDSQGRARVEQVWRGRTIVAILDPVSRYFIDLDTDNKTARRNTIPEGANAGGISISGGVVSRSLGSQVRVVQDLVDLQLKYQTAVATAGGRGASPVTVTSATAGGGVNSATYSADTVSTGRGGRGGRGAANNTLYEDLGVQSQNGVLATGSRNTLTIPQGQIGNNRDIHVVNERWFSEDLQMLVKTVNSDPRFGENTYQLTNVSRTEPDPALFQIPSDYTIIDTPAGGRGGRAGSPIATPVNK